MSILGKTGTGLQYPVELTWKRKTMKTFVRAVSYSTPKATTSGGIFTSGVWGDNPPEFHEDPGDLLHVGSADNVTLFAILSDDMLEWVRNTKMVCNPTVMSGVAKSEVVAEGKMFHIIDHNRSLLLRGALITGIDEERKMVQISIDYTSLVI